MRSIKLRLPESLIDSAQQSFRSASSNKPELVVVVESMTSEDDMRDLFRDEVKPRLGKHKEVGAYNQVQIAPARSFGSNQNKQRFVQLSLIHI